VQSNQVHGNQVHGDPVVGGEPAPSDGLAQHGLAQHGRLDEHGGLDEHGQLDLTGHTALDQPGQELHLSNRQVRDFTTPRAGRISRDRPFKQSQLTRIDEALTLASRETGLLFSVYIGPLGDEPRLAADRLFSRLAAQHAAPVLLAVSPAERRMEIVTGGESARRIPNRVAGLAALAMRASFSSGDLTGGIISGLRQLADAAGMSGTVVSYS
jgi:hypothetical protein